MTRREMTAQALVAAGALAATLLSARAAVSTPLGVLWIAATAELAARVARPTYQRIMIAAGFVLVVLVLLAIVINVLPWGLTTRTWVAGWACVSATVIAGRRRCARPRVSLVLSARVASLYLVSLGILAASIALAIVGAKHADKPPTALGIVGEWATSVRVRVVAGAQPGRYLLVRGVPPVLGGGDDTAFSLQRGESKDIIVPVAMSGVTRITLVGLDGVHAIRTLIVRRSTIVPSAAPSAAVATTRIHSRGGQATRRHRGPRPKP